MKKTVIEKVWALAMNNVTVSACLFTLAIGLAIGAVCVLLDSLFC